MHSSVCTSFPFNQQSPLSWGTDILSQKNVEAFQKPKAV